MDGKLTEVQVLKTINVACVSHVGAAIYTCCVGDIFMQDAFS